MLYSADDGTFATDHGRASKTHDNLRRRVDLRHENSCSSDEVGKLGFTQLCSHPESAFIMIFATNHLTFRSLLLAQ